MAERPHLAALCLAQIGGEEAIPTLFAQVKGEDFFDDEGIIAALKIFGEKSQSFFIRSTRQSSHKSR